MSHWENWMTEEQYVFLQKKYLILHIFPPIVFTLFHILLLKRTVEMRSGMLPGYRHYQYQYTF